MARATGFRDHLRDEHGIGRFAESLKEIIYGGNDGIVTTFAVVAGFAGASADGAAVVGSVAVLLFGLANLFSDAASMGLGAFLSARSQRDVYLAARSSEIEEIRTNTAKERVETLEILRQRGVESGDAEALADIYERNPDLYADFMMYYEIGMPDPTDGSPAMDGLMTFLSFMAFGAIPLIPYFVLEPSDFAFNLSCWATGIALTLLGLLRWQVTREAMLRCVTETLLVGGTCAIIAYAVGMAFRL